MSDKINTLLFWTRLRDSVRPPIFFLGVCFGFLCCCAAGKTAAGSNPYLHFRRFYAALNPESDYFATVSQLIAIAKEPLVQGKTLVIIGGNSVGFGVGESEQLWSDQLQLKLGPSFAVCNFAMNGNYSPLGGPYLAFLSLSRFYQKIYYVTFSRPGCQDDIDGSFCGYSYYWDARYKGLLPSMEIQEKNIDLRNVGLTSADRAKLDETLIGAYLDSYFYFRDLWTTIAYNSICTIWTKETSANFLLPRRLYRDVDPPINLAAPERFAHLDQPSAVEHIRFLFPSLFGKAENMPDKIPDSPFKVILETQILSSIPKNLRGRIFQVDVKCCPYFLNKLSSRERREYDLIADFNRTIWLKAGCHQIEVGSNYRDDDYIDAFHLSPAGGVKLAKTVADCLLEEARGK